MLNSYRSIVLRLRSKKMSQEGPTLHSFTTSQPIPAPVPAPSPDADATMDENGHSTVLEDQDQTVFDANETTDSVRQQVEEDSENKDTNEGEGHSRSNVEEDEYEEGDEHEEDASGTSVLPLSKIKKIFKTDPEHVSASEAAVFTSAVAAELFIQYFTEQASLIARSEKRKKLQYKDFSSAVANIEQLYFLGDTVPKTHNLKKLVDQDKVRYNQDPSAKPLVKGQTTLQFGKKGRVATKKADDEELPESEDENDLGDGFEYNDPENEDQQQPRQSLNPDGDDDDDDENNDNTDEENEESVTEVPHIRKDKDHDIIMN